MKISLFVASIDFYFNKPLGSCVRGDDRCACARSPGAGDVGHVTEESAHYYCRPSGGVSIDRPLSWVHRRLTGAVLMKRNGVKGDR